MNSNHYALLADLILVVHFAFVLFVVVGFALILCGMAASWRWVENRTFRLIHLAAIGIVVLQAWLGQLCPLTIWESQLRRLAGEQGYSGSFIEHWLHKVMFFEAEQWVFMLIYTVFGLLVALTWWLGRKRAQQ
ncbi:MAG: DUF2784 domain-containing protein [Pseudomonadota bacterium]